MKKAVLYCVCALLLFQILLSVVYFLAKKGLIHYQQPVFEQCDRLFNSTDNQEYIFIGSSRTHYGINPLILERLSGKTVLNGGFEGAKITEMELILNGFLFKHNNPKKIFLMLDPHSLDLTENQLHNTIYFSHYLSNDALYEGVYACTGLSAFFWKHIPYSILTEFDDYTRSNCIKGLMHKTYLTPTQYAYKGYMSLKAPFLPEDSVISLKHALHEGGVRVLLRMAETCSGRGIPLQIIQGPYLDTFYSSNNIDSMYLNINALLKKYSGVSTQTTALNYTDTSYFKDQVHLKEAGATKYSMDVFSNFINHEQH